MINYIRFFNEDRFEVIKDSEIKISNILPNIMKDAIYNKDIKDDMYILCPVYQQNEYQIYLDQEDISNKYSNFQIGITGSIKHGDSYYRTFVKELGEELGLQPIKGYKFNEYKNLSKEKVKIVYIINITKLSPIVESLEFDKGIDNRNIKIGSIIYGTLNNVLNFLSIKNIILNQSNDRISGVVALNVRYAKNYINNFVYRRYLRQPLLTSKNGLLIRSKNFDFNYDLSDFDNYQNLVNFLDILLK